MFCGKQEREKNMNCDSRKWSRIRKGEEIKEKPNDENNKEGKMRKIRKMINGSREGGGQEE